MTGKLSNEVLLNIFRYYLDASPRFWLVLGHICRKWRRIVFASQQALRLRLFCAQGTHFLKTLGYWPSLPIVVEYGGSPELDPPVPKDEDDIMAALEQSDRVSSISLTITSSLLEKLFVIERPFSELEYLVVLSRDRQWLTLPNIFGWSTQLRRLHLTNITFFALPRLLYSSTNLVDIQLHEVHNPWLFSPDALTDALSGMAQLGSLSLHFSFAIYDIDVSLPSRKRVVLPALTRLNYRGIDRYLEGLVSGVDAPRLGDIEATLTNTEYYSELLELREFIDRIEMPQSHLRAHISFSSELVISISSMQPEAPSRTCLKLRLLYDQLFSMAQICARFSSFLFNVEDLRISAMRPSRWKYHEKHNLLDLLYSFAGVKLLHIAGDSLTDIVDALQLSPPQPVCETLLPDLHKFCIAQPGPSYEPLRVAVVSFMTLRRQSGRPIGVEYEPLRYTSQLRGTGSLQQVAIEELTDDVLLNIFRHYLDATPRYWSRLAHVCRRWREIVFLSTLGLDLRLYCTYGTPVLKNLECWPPLPLVVDYGGSPGLDPPAREDEENIMAALKRFDRVGSIGLTVTPSLLENLSTIKLPFSELEELNLLSQDNLQLTLPSAFRWGLLLRTLYLTRVAIPALPQLLSPSTGIVDLQLHEIPIAGLFSPEAFANALSGMTHLRSLSLHFLSFLSRRQYIDLLPPPGERVVLPALTCLKYRGTSKFFDCLVARIDAPSLRDIDITFFSQPTMDASQLGQFIDRIEMLNSESHHRAHIVISESDISITLTQQNALIRLEIRISCKQLDWQVSSMAQICDHFSPFLFRVEDLDIFAVPSQTLASSELSHVDSEQWLKLIRAFSGAKDFRVAGEHMIGILLALGPAYGDHQTDTTVLPSLRKLRLPRSMERNTLWWDVVQSFITPRQLSGRPVELDVLCHICNTSFTRLQELKRHLVDKHSYQIVCSYCGNFKCEPGYNDQFREHLANKHPEVAHTDTLIDIFGPFTASVLPKPIFTIAGHPFDISEVFTYGGDDFLGTASSWQQPLQLGTITPAA